jgi:hypothetical protein
VRALSRRAVLGAGAAVAGTALIPAIGEANSIARAVLRRDPRVVIIGADLAGLACAEAPPHPVTPRAHAP